MRKVINLSFLVLVSVFIFCNISYADQNDNVGLSTTVREYLALEITAGDTIAFGNLIPGSPLKGASGTEVSITTSGANGYELYISDSVAASDSALLHSDLSTRISDYAGTIALPTSWSGTGLGFCLYAGTAKAAKWGTGTTYDDENNKYAGVPENDTEIMNKTGYSADPDLSYIGWQVDVAGDQKTGNYSGEVTISAVASL